MRCSPLLLILAACSSPAPSAPDGGVPDVSCVELSNLGQPAHGVCATGDSVVVGDEVWVTPSVGADVQTSFTCKGVPCDVAGYLVMPRAAGILTVDVAMQSVHDGERVDVEVPPLVVSVLDRVDVSCPGCAAPKRYDDVVVSVAGTFQGAPRSLAYNEPIAASDPPAALGQYAGALTWEWKSVQPGTHTLTAEVGGLPVAVTFVVP